MLKSFSKYLFMSAAITLAIASCQQPSATTTSPTPSVAAASPQATPSRIASASPSPKASSTANPSSAKTKDVDAFVKGNTEYKEMYDATDGVKYVGLVETETCKALDAGVPFPTLIDALEKEFDKQGSSMPAEKLTKLKEYTGFVVGASVAIACPQHKDKIKT